MKKALLLTLMAVLGIAVSSNAQSAQFRLGYGGYTQMDCTDMHNGGGDVNNAWGAVTAAANFRVLPKMYLGASYTFSSSSRKGHHHQNLYYHTFMANAYYDYYRNSIVKLYSHLGIGVDVTHMTYADNFSMNKAYFAFQASPLGAEVGISRSLGMYGELGFGAQGVLQVGLRYNL